MQVDLAVIATRNYKRYVQDLIRSVDSFFFPKDDVRVLLFVDDFCDVHTHRVSVSQRLIPSYGFPDATLYRFDIFASSADMFTGDLTFYVDVDTKFVKPFEVYPPAGKNFVAVAHINNKTVPGPWEDRVESHAFTPYNLRRRYYAGGFYGARNQDFMGMARHLQNNILADTNLGITAIWHDESHLNCYLAMRPHAVFELPDSYCWPENKENPYAVLHALVKDHNAIRSAPDPNSRIEHHDSPARPFETEDVFTREVSITQLDNPDPYPYGTYESYRAAADFLRDCSTIEDWGCGRRWFSQYIEEGQQYIGVDMGLDGQRVENLHVDVTAGLQDYTSTVEGILLRHVLDHNYDWKSILRNALASFTKKLCVVVHTPFIAGGQLQRVDENGVPTISFDFHEFVEEFGGVDWKMEHINSVTFFRGETIFYLRK